MSDHYVSAHDKFGGSLWKWGIGGDRGAMGPFTVRVDGRFVWSSASLTVGPMWPARPQLLVDPKTGKMQVVIERPAENGVEEIRVDIDEALLFRLLEDCVQAAKVQAKLRDYERSKQ